MINKVSKIFVLILLLINPTSIIANDSLAEVTASGLQFMQTTLIKMKKEDLHIYYTGYDEASKISVRYEFYNQSEIDITETVAFPLPMTTNDNYFNLDETDESKLHHMFGKFTVKVNGKEQEYKTLVQAVSKTNIDITEELKKNNIPIDPRIIKVRLNKNQNYFNTLNLKKDILKKYINIENNVPYPKWRAKKTYYWNVTFRAKKITVIAHAYQPESGVHWADMIKSNGKTERYFVVNDELEDRYSYPYCIKSDQTKRLVEKFKTADNSDILAIYKKNANVRRPLLVDMHTMSYILGTGANWAGPIEQFNLTIVHPKETILSVCIPGPESTVQRQRSLGNIVIKQTIPNFVPINNLNLLVMTPAKVFVSQPAGKKLVLNPISGEVYAPDDHSEKQEKLTKPKK